MRLQSQYLPKAWMQAAVDQVAHEYEAKGYRVTRDERMGRYRADLVARKGKEQIVLEFKQGPWSAEWQQTALALRKRVQQDPRGAFRLVVVSPPTLPQIDVEGLNEILASLCHGDADSQVDELATHHFLEEIADIEVDNVKIGKNSIELVGDATAEYRLQFGSDSDVEKDEGLVGQLAPHAGEFSHGTSSTDARRALPGRLCLQRSAR